MVWLVIDNTDRVLRRFLGPDRSWAFFDGAIHALMYAGLAAAVCAGLITIRRDDGQSHQEGEDP